MRHKLKYVNVLGFLVAAFAALPATSQAQQLAYTAKDVNVRAGPARAYPVVAVLRAGTPISVQGCLSDYQWCDVAAGPYRGWLYAGNILYSYQGANVPVLSYGGALGIGIIAFSLGTYWDDHYRGRPWYPQRQQWIARPQSFVGPTGHRLPPGPGFAPSGGQRPPPGQWQGGGRAPHIQAPGAGPRSAQGQWHDNGQRPPRGQAMRKDQRSPQDQGRANTHRH